jgi:ABC-2 type transport system ATP-binding protein/lipopolysaccharide transport system ATP-binding protein
LWALRDIDLQIGQGEVVGIIGRNGAGKTTLLRILARITEPTVGVSRTRGRVGALLEVGTGFHPELTGRENVFLNGAILGMSTAEVRGRFDEIIDFAGVGRFVDTPLKRYSSGMELRLAFAVAAHFEPDVIVVDEVLAVGDAEFQRRCLGRMTELTEEGRTVLFVTHDHGAMARLVSRVVWLDAGEIVADGPAPKVLGDYLDAVTAARAERHVPARRAGAVVVRSVDAFSPAEQRRIDPVRGSPLHLSVVFELTERITGLDVGFYLKSEDGTWLLNEAWSDEHGAMPVDRPGEYTATLIVPAVFTAGRYTVALWMGSPYETLIDEDIASFDITPRLEDRQEAIRRPRTVQPTVTWELSRSSSSSSGHRSTLNSGDP